MSAPLFGLNPLVGALDAPPIPEAKTWLAGYDGRGGPPIDLSQAVPGTPPPEAMLERLAAAAGSIEATRYGPILGDGLLREAYGAEVAATYRAPLAAGQVAITAGGNMAFIAAILALARAGENVILPAPWYFNHQMSLAMLGIEPRILPSRAGAGFVPDSEEAGRLVDSRTRAIVLVTPNNPTGAIYPPEVIARFAALARGRGIALVLDETYRDFLPGETSPHQLFADPDWDRTLISLYSFSKAYAVPGYRLGAVLAHPALVAEIGKVLDNLQICPPRAAQSVIAWAIEGIREWRRGVRDDLAARAEATRAAFQMLPGWRIDSIGAYFAYIAHPDADGDGAALARRLAEERGVLALPGSFFGPGQKSHLRFAFANVGKDVLGGLASRLA